jgi:hypothetical protein
MISGATLSGQPAKAIGHAVGKLTLRHDLSASTALSFFLSRAHCSTH